MVVAPVEQYYLMTGWEQYFVSQAVSILLISHRKVGYVYERHEQHLMTGWEQYFVSQAVSILLISHRKVGYVYERHEQHLTELITDLVVDMLAHFWYKN